MIFTPTIHIISGCGKELYEHETVRQNYRPIRKVKS